MNIHRWGVTSLWMIYKSKTSPTLVNVPIQYINGVIIIINNTGVESWGHLCNHIHPFCKQSILKGDLETAGANLNQKRERFYSTLHWIPFTQVFFLLFFLLNMLFWMSFTQSELFCEEYHFYHRSKRAFYFKQYSVFSSLFPKLLQVDVFQNEILHLKYSFEMLHCFYLTEVFNYHSWNQADFWINDSHTVIRMTNDFRTCIWIITLSELQDGWSEMCSTKNHPDSRFPCFPEKEFRQACVSHSGARLCLQAPTEICLFQPHLREREDTEG